MTPQESAINQDKKYAMKRGDLYMVHAQTGTRTYNGSDLEEAQRILATTPGGVFTDLTISENQTTVAQKEIELHKSTCLRANMRYLVVNVRNGKKLYAGGDLKKAKSAVINHTCSLFDLHV